MKCFYHSSDLDGHCSGAIVKRFHPDCELIGINYGDEFPWNGIKRGETIYMVDFSLQPFEQMHDLDQWSNLTWIDHHKSSIEEQRKNPLVRATAILGDGNAGCELTWEHLYPDEQIPVAVYLLGRYDVWDHSDKRTLPFQYGLRMEDTRPENQGMWDHLFTRIGNVANVLKAGETVLRYINQTNEKYVNACAFETDLDGLHCIAVNRMLTNSQTFDTIWNPSKYDAMLTFGWRKGKWTVSLYSDRNNIDVSTVAKARGGGGHKGAAGFQCQELPFDLK